MENVEKVKRDNRAISDEFFERFKPEGDLHPFVKLVKEYEDELVNESDLLAGQDATTLFFILVKLFIVISFKET